jgi:hypothetical protein
MTSVRCIGDERFGTSAGTARYCASCPGCQFSVKQASAPPKAFAGPSSVTTRQPDLMYDATAQLSFGMLPRAT